MALPETIPVKYTEEEAAYLSVRPVVRQTFRLDELLDLILGVTGKDVARVQQILRSGTVVFHFYRYWWQGFEAQPEELGALLARFPDADPARAFRVQECTGVLLESGGPAPRYSVELTRDAAAHKRWFRSRSSWDSLMDMAAGQAVAYDHYSYARHADVYRLEVSPGAATLVREAKRLAPRALRAQLLNLAEVSRIFFLCSRRGK